LKYRIEYHDTESMQDCWHIQEGSYPSKGEAMRAIRDLMALGGPWVDRAYRVGSFQSTALTHTELVRMAEHLNNHGALVGLWFGEEGEEAVLFNDDEIAAAVPGGPVRRGWRFGRPIHEAVRELVARDHEAVAQERERAAAQERERVAKQTREHAAAQERERAAAQERERAAAQERERVATQAREHAAAQERERAAALERERVAKQAREHAAAEAAQQRAAAQERERAAAVEAQQRAATQARGRAAARERELVAALEAQLRSAAHERERAASQERERAAAVEGQQRAAALEAQQRAAALERERVAIQARERAMALERERAAALERERVAKQTRERSVALERERVAALEAKQRAGAKESERAAALEAQQRSAAQERERTASQERERAAALARKGEATMVPITRPVATPPVAAIGRPASRTLVAPLPKLGGEGELVALAKLLRCGPWPEGMKACDLVTPDRLPAGAHAALQELAGTAALNVRALGNALKRVLDKRIEGIPRKVTRTIDNHGFAIWQIVNDLGETSTTSDRPGNAELLRGALTGMGYGAAEANHAVSALRARLDTDSLTALVREALGVLALRPTSGSKPKRR
jgi:hypothetical protein